ncbi:Putative odorant receptor 22c [Camponotus floridanus]|uniref:Putative odorant receptor 22c n=1 Tax=Camponotus floridanus TaxID=104421 RepID=E2A1T9_CAMFO|nr:Putative odorant receptor 22c [Camponotus floridanus]
MENYYKQAQKYEKEIFQQYVDKCMPFYGIILGWLAMTGVSVITAPLFSSQSFPSEAEYPFDVQHQPLKTLIYAHHILTAYQSVIQVSANTFPALLLWFVAARFQILSTRFRTMTNMKELINYTREHYILLRYAKEVSLAVRYIALLCVTFSTGAVIFGYLTFMSRQPWSVKWTFLMIAFCGFVELYMYAWPADHVISTSSDIASAVYDSLWYNDDLAIRKILVHVIRRSQHPVTISVPCALPDLSMNYYASSSDIASAVYDSLWYNDDLVMRKLLINVILRGQHPVTVSVPCALPSLSMSYYASYVSTVFSYMASVRIIMGQE